MAPPPLRVPLPSLFLNPQQQQPPLPRDAVSPLRWRSDRPSLAPFDTTTISSMETTGAQARKHDKKQRSRTREMPNESEALNPARVRKPSYVLQREERDELAEEVQALEDQLEELRVRAGLPTRADKAAIRQVASHSREIDDKLHMNALYIAKIHSLVTNEMLLPNVNPLATFLHLPRDMDQRRAILRGMQTDKLRRGIQIVTENLYHLDPTMPYKCEDKFTTETGESHFFRIDINQFPNFQTARQLFDTYVAFLSTMEISVTEMLGQLTVREDTNAFDPTIWNHRFLTVADDVGVPEELNIVGFAQYYDYTETTQSPMGVVVYDTVNRDDLYPYIPEERTCKDVQTVNLVCEVPKPGAPHETVVVLKQISVVVQLAPQFPVDPKAREQLDDNIARWPNTILKYLREYVVATDNSSAWRPSAPAATGEWDRERMNS